jgi:transposase
VFGAVAGLPGQMLRSLTWDQGSDWLCCWGVERAGMEATDYWKPVYFLLEREGLDCVLYQASQVKVLPGRPKTDKLDSVWLAKVTERGSLAGSFVPPEDIRRLRTHTRYRRRLTQARTTEKQRAEKLLEDAHLKLSSVIADIHGVSGRVMLRAVIAGERNPRALAEMALGVMRRKIAALEEALNCSFFTEEHAFVLAVMLDNIDHYSAQIAVLDERIAALCEPYERQIAQLDAIPGFGVKTAQDLIAEIGADMRNATGRGNPYIGAALGEASATIGRTQTFLAAKYRRLCRHMPKKKAQVAIMRTQLAAAHALLSHPQAEYLDPGPGYYEQQADARRLVHGHVRGLERLGWKVTLEPINPETGELTPEAVATLGHVTPTRRSRGAIHCL